MSQGAQRVRENDGCREWLVVSASEYNRIQLRIFFIKEGDRVIRGKRGCRCSVGLILIGCLRLAIRPEKSLAWSDTVFFVEFFDGRFGTGFFWTALGSLTEFPVVERDRALSGIGEFDVIIIAVAGPSADREFGDEHIS